MPDPFAARPLFAIPLFASRIDGAEDHNGPLAEEILRQRALDPTGEARSVHHGWHSGDAFRQSRHPSLGWVMQRCLGFAEKALAPRYGDWRDHQLRLRSFWANVLEGGGFHAPHHHHPRHWSGVYYVTVGEPVEDELAGCIEFLDPNPTVPGAEPRHRHRPEAGQVLLFPASLMHLVYPVPDGTTRITVAFNVDVGGPPRASAV